MKTMTAGGLVLACTGRVWAKAKVREIPISLQLYSVRNECGKDFDKALAEVAAMGFAGVEFAGYHTYGGKAKELRKRLDDLNLKATGTHIGTASLKGDALKGTVEFHQTLGCKYLIVPGDNAFSEPEGSKKFAETLNAAMETLRPLGMACGYHNHKEIAKVDPETQKTYWDLFAERTADDVVLQQDCGWSAAAGLDPAQLIRKHPGRTKIPHFKPTVVKQEADKKAILGQDSVDWKSVIKACREVGGTEWFVIEQEVYPDGQAPMECAKRSLAGLRDLLAARD